MTNRRYASLLILALVLAACVSPPAQPTSEPAPQAPPATAPAPKAAEWPAQSITWVAASNPGGFFDRFSRGWASFMHPYFPNVPLVVENRPGGQSLLGTAYFMKDPRADEGYMLLQTAEPQIALMTNVLGADFTLDDLAIITAHWTDSLLVAVPQNSPYNSLKDLIDDIKARPGKVSFGVVGTGSGHLFGGMLFDKLGIWENVNVVIYDGGAPERLGTVAGHHDFGITYPTIIEDGVKVLAVVLEERNKDLPNVPTINEALKPYGVEVPIMPGAMRYAAAKATFRDKYPDRWAKVVAAYKGTIENKDFQTWLKAQGMVAEWVSPEESTRQVKIYHDVVRQYKHLLQ